MIHRLAVFLTDCLVFQMRSEQRRAAAARIEHCFVFYSGQDETQTTLLLYIGRRQRMNRRGRGVVRALDGESSDRKWGGPGIHRERMKR